MTDYEQSMADCYDGCMQVDVMLDIDGEIELLERCARECALMSDLAMDRRTRYENETLAAEYRDLAKDLRSYRSS
jgi:hypothetical protein